MIFWQYLRTFISGLIILYLQILVIPSFAIEGIIPNILIGWIVYQVWKKPLPIFLPVLFIIGICYDLTMPNLLGLQTIIFIVLAVGLNEFYRPLEKDSVITMLLTISLAVISYTLLNYLAIGIMNSFSVSLLYQALGLMAYNMVSSILTAAIFLFLSRLKLDINDS